MQSWRGAGAVPTAGLAWPDRQLLYPTCPGETSAQVPTEKASRIFISAASEACPLGALTSVHHIRDLP